VARGQDGRVYACIDLKSFYASVECVDRGLDPLAARLVVADPTRTKKTICLAITPAMKALGIRNRCRLFEIPEGTDFVIARPHMRRYMEVSASIYAIYLRYISPDDIHVYSVDECFIDLTSYVSLYGKTPRELAVMLMDAVLSETGICATAGIGTNLFLAKVALDVTAKHAADHIGWLDEASFARTVQTHRPITDIWNVGPGIAERLERYGVHDLRGVCALDEATLYREFGVNAEYLIDHAHGREPCTIAQIHAYEPRGHSLMNGQVLACDYTFDEALVVLREMADQTALDLVDKRLVAASVSLWVGYAREGPPAGRTFDGGHGRRVVAGPRSARVPDHTGATRTLAEPTNSRRRLAAALVGLWRETTLPDRPIRRISIGVGRLVPEEFATSGSILDIEADDDERAVAEAVIAVKDRFGKNALVRGISLTEKATARERNEQIGGHRA
jgi:DNA polymerase V